MIQSASSLIVVALVSVSAVAQSAQRVELDVVAARPHDSKAFTQGLLWYEGVLYESTGLYGESTLRAVDATTGAVQRSVKLAPTMFAEGLARVGDRLIQLTWREGVAFIYDLATFAVVGQFSYTGEGWGLCHDGTRLVMSDGSARLQFRDPQTFAGLATVDVTLDGQPLRRLNELECVDGRVFANVWGSNDIVRIDPASGIVEAVIDARGLLTSAEQANADVLNGIAYDAGTGNFMITGKLWPRLFVSRLTPQPAADGAPSSGESDGAGRGDHDANRTPVITPPSGCFRAVAAPWPAGAMALCLLAFTRVRRARGGQR